VLQIPEDRVRCFPKIQMLPKDKGSILPQIKTVKVTLEQAIKAQRGVDVELYSFFNLGAIWGRWSTPRPGRFTRWNQTVPTV